MKNNSFLNSSFMNGFLSDLQKTELYKIGTRSVVDPAEFLQAYKVVPKTVMSFLVSNINNMEIGSVKELHLPFAANTKMHISKVEKDQYTGSIEQDNKKITEFALRSLPGVGLVLLSSLELYNLNELNQDAGDQEKEVKIQKLIDDRLALHELIEKVVDKKITEKDAIQQMFLRRLQEELNKTKEELERERVRLAGVGVAATGYAQDVKEGAYGYSDSLNQVNKLYKEKEELRKNIEKKSSDIKNMTDIMSNDPIVRKEEYFRGMANGLKVADSAMDNKNPDFIDAPKKPGDIGYADDFTNRVNKRIKKKGSPLIEFLEKKEKKREFTVSLMKNESINCPDCNTTIFDGEKIEACLCFGDCGKIKLNKTENILKISFSKSWDSDNIEMFLDVLRGKNG